MTMADLPLSPELASLFAPARPPTTSTRDVWALVPTRVQLAEPVPAWISPGRVAEPQAPVPTPADEPPRRVFARIGVMRDIRVGERRWVVRERKGYRYIESMLVKPHQAMLATSLQAAIDGRDPRLYAGSAGPILTTGGRDELRARANDCREELSEARIRGDVAGEERLLSELTAIAEAVTGATDRRGRVRQQRDHDGVRIAVTNAIRRAIWSIAQVAPEVATYLQSTISTGTWLIYRPVADEQWEIRHAA